jgi:tetraacyldisaccharide 4'-kinase
MFGATRRVGADVICVGNLTAGGTGKTPLCLALNDILTAVGKRTCFLTRGYGGRIDDPSRVDVRSHTFQDVGDEALLLAQGATTYISPTRYKGAQAATRDGADIIIMDDGFQNPALRKDLSFVVIDGPAGLGNRLMIPAGPLRESMRLGLHRCDAVIVLGDLRDGPEREILAKIDKPVFQAHIRGDLRTDLDLGKPTVAFSGIGRPEKFFQTLRDLSCTLVEAVPYPDHHPYSEKEQLWLKSLAEERQAQLVTTSKDFVRLSLPFRSQVKELPVRALFDNPDDVEGFVHQHLLNKDRGKSLPDTPFFD